MNRIKFLLGLMVFALLIQAAGAQAATTVSVSPSYSNLNLGDPLVITIDITTDEDLYAPSITLNYDPSILNATSVTEESFLKQGGAGTFPIINIDEAQGIVSYDSTRFGTSTGATGSGTLATITFDTIGAGLSQLGLTGDLVGILPGSVLYPMSFTENNGSAKVNTPPTINEVAVSPNPAYTLDTLDCGFDVTDPDVLDTVKVNVTWLKNGAPWTEDDENEIVIASWGNTGAQGNIEPGDTVKGDTWVCRVTAYDELSEVSQDSSLVSIENSLPTQPAVDLTPDSPYTVDDLLCTVTSPTTDADVGDTVNYIFKWYKDDVLQPAETTTTTGLTDTVSSSQTARGELWKCDVTPNDGTGDGASSFDSHTILNSKPVASGLGLLPSGPVTSDNLIGSYSYSDDDLDPEAGTEIRWYKDTVLQPAYNDVLTIPSSATAKGQEWYFTVKPGDGSEFGTLQTSPTVTVLNTVPDIQEVFVKPSNPSDELVCWFRITDDDSDAIDADITWLKDGLPWANDDENNIAVTAGVLMETSFVGNIESEDIEYNDRWTCQVTAFDDEDSGTFSNYTDVLTSVLVNPSSYGASVGGSFDIKIDMDSTDDVYAVSFNLAFDPSIISVTSALEGDFLNNDAASTSPIININNTAGTITYANTRLEVGYGTSGYGSLLDITFYAETSGSSALDLDELIVVNSGLKAEPSALRDGDVTVILLTGDVDRNCAVNIFDLASVGLAYGSRPGDLNWNPQADLTGDDKINIFDLATVGLNYGRSC